MPSVDYDLVLQTCGAHPARRLAFEDLLKGLEAEVQSKNVKCVKHGSLALFSYTKETVYSKKWNVFSLISRGLILDIDQKKVLATPFPKFFNYGEVTIGDAEEADGEILVSNKYDGSLGIVFYHAGKWRVATRGSFISDQAAWAQKWLDHNIALSHLIVGTTYLFEIVYPGNRIVVPYDFEGLVLLGAYNEDGLEFSRSDLDCAAKTINVRMAEITNFINVEELVRKADNLGRTSEGWVIRFGNGHRIKIKGAEYIRLHRLISNVSPLAIWEMLARGDHIEAARCELPEELQVDFDRIVEVLLKCFDSLITSISEFVEATKDLDDKALGLLLQRGKLDNGAAITKQQGAFVFPARKSNFIEAVKDPSSVSRQRAFMSFRPTGNILPGYTPSTAMTRFQNESG